MTTDLDNLVVKAWPTSPPEDAARLSKLTPEEERLICVRLAALLEVEQGKRPASRAPDDDPRSIGSNGFQSLVRRWRKQRTVSMLLPYETRQPRKPKALPKSDEFEAFIETLLRRDPSIPLVTVSKQAMKTTGAKMAINSARLRARAVRSAIRSDKAWLKENYGKRLLMDICILGAELEGTSGVNTAVIALLVDTASGYILGHAIGPIKDSLDLQKAALANGLANVASSGLDRKDVSSVILDCVIGVGTDEAVSSMSETLRASGAPVTVIDNPTRRCGDRANDVLDGSVDILALRPRQGRQSRRFGNERWELERLILAGTKSVEDHNSDRKARIISAIGTARTNKGKILEALESVKNI